MPIYQTKGTLTGTIEPEHVSAAQQYLQNDDMTKFLDEPMGEIIERIQWNLDNDGHHYVVEVIAKRELTDRELDILSRWVSGQNSDGLGESFEQQDFAEIPPDEDEFEEDGKYADWGMIRFDWETNDSKFERVV